MSGGRRHGRDGVDLLGRPVPRGATGRRAQAGVRQSAQRCFEFTRSTYRRGPQLTEAVISRLTAQGVIGLAVAPVVITCVMPHVLAWSIGREVRMRHWGTTRSMSITPLTLRREQLRDALPAIVAMINADRVDFIPRGFVDDYVALSWLEDRGAGLQLTYSGAALCMEITVRAK